MLESADGSADDISLGRLSMTDRILSVRRVMKIPDRVIKTVSSDRVMTPEINAFIISFLPYI